MVESLALLLAAVVTGPSSFLEPPFDFVTVVDARAAGRGVKDFKDAGGLIGKPLSMSFAAVGIKMEESDDLVKGLDMEDAWEYWVRRGGGSWITAFGGPFAGRN